MVFRINRMREMISNTLNQKHPIKFLFGYFLYKTGFCKYFDINFHSFKIQFFPTKLSWLLYADNELYTSELEFYRRYLRKDNVVVDVGANIGLISLFSSNIVGGGGKVISFEPNPEIFKYFDENIRLNHFQNIETHCMALGKTESYEYLDLEEYDDCRVKIQDRGNVQVIVRTFDGELDKIQQISLVKIDVEGYEKFVLEGAEKSAQKIKCIIFESYSRHFKQFSYSFKNLFDILTEYGFDIYSFPVEEKISRIPREHISENCENLIAIKGLDKFLELTGYSVQD